MSQEVALTVLNMALRVFWSFLTGNVFHKRRFCAKGRAYLNTRIVDIYKSKPVGSNVSIKVTVISL
jgi:hypothetical protein